MKYYHFQVETVGLVINQTVLYHHQRFLIKLPTKIHSTNDNQGFH